VHQLGNDVGGFLVLFFEGAGADQLLSSVVMLGERSKTKNKKQTNNQKKKKIHKTTKKKRKHKKTKTRKPKKKKTKQQTKIKTKQKRGHSSP